MKKKTRTQLLNEYWKKNIREIALSKNKICPICKKRPSNQVHHVLGRKGLSGFLNISPSASIAVCAGCHMKEKLGNPFCKVDFLKRAFLSAGGHIKDDIWSIETELGTIEAFGHNSISIKIKGVDDRGVSRFVNEAIYKKTKLIK